MTSDPYDKHFWRFADEYPREYADDACLALWHRLVQLAGMAWPSSGTLPYGTKRRALKMLTDADPPLVLLEDGGRFQVRGMDKERSKRQQSASHAARTRWRNADGSADGNADGSAPSNADGSAPSNAGGDA